MERNRKIWPIIKIIAIQQKLLISSKDIKTNYMTYRFQMLKKVKIDYVKCDMKYGKSNGYRRKVNWDEKYTE